MHRFTPDTASSLGGPSWLTRRRTEAAERFGAEPMPSAEAEEWRYSPIADLDLERFDLAPETAAEPPPLPVIDTVPAATVVMVNGRLRSLELADDVAAAGVRVTVVGAESGAGSVGDGSTAGDDGAAEVLGRVIEGTEDHFSVLNDAFVRAPVVIDVPSGAHVDRPIVVHHHVAGDRVADFPRLAVRVGRDAAARVLDIITSAADDHTLVCPLAELDVDAAGRLGYLNVQQLGDASWQIGSQVARAERDSTLVAATAGLGGDYARTRADTRLVGRGAHGDLLSLYFGDASQTLDFRTFQDHVAPDTTSNLLYKGALGGEARSVYTGLIRVRPDARGTNAFQTNRNLKLSEDAWAESVPNLEIENNDVRCSHASTVGPVDVEQLFYLESRGVPTATAERLIVAGFFAEVLAALPVPSVAPTLRSAVAAKLARQAPTARRREVVGS